MDKQTTENQETQVPPQQTGVTLAAGGTTRVEIKTPEAMVQTAPEAQEAPPQEAPKDAALGQMLKEQQQAETEIKSDLTAKGVDFSALEAEYEQKGELSAKSRDQLEKAGYPKSVVDAYINGLNANAEKFVSAVKQYVGGEQAYADLSRYVQSQGEGIRKAFNAVLETGDLGQIQLALSGLKAQMVTTYGTQGRTIMGGSSATQTVGYQTTAEMVKDMSDPRYQKDPKFTQEVMRKVQMSPLF